MSQLQVTAKPRTIIGRQVRQIRNQRAVPVVVYGKKTAPASLTVDERMLERVLRSGGLSRIVEVNVEGAEQHNVLIRDVQRHPVSHRLLHADFYAIDMTEKQHVNVPIVQTGKASGFSTGLLVLQDMDSIEIEALPSDIPLNITVDITPLTLEHPIRVADLPVLSGVTYKAEASEHVFTLVVTREEVEAATEGVAAEPEVVAAKGKKEEE
jgi:large subunit ribosomal protein L25